jgi:hypothetical protein
MIVSSSRPADFRWASRRPMSASRAVHAPKVPGHGAEGGLGFAGNLPPGHRDRLDVSAHVRLGEAAVARLVFGRRVISVAAGAVVSGEGGGFGEVLAEVDEAPANAS